MSDQVYLKLAKVLDTLPNGFPSTESGVEMKLLKKVFAPMEADLFCDLRLHFETAGQIAERTGRPVEGLEERLSTMASKGQIFGVKLGATQIFKMMPWIFGIYEFQLSRLDKEFAELNEEFFPIYGLQFLKNTPQLMQTLPIEKEIPVSQEALPYERVSSIIEQGQSFLANDCICKKEKGLIGKPCDRPLDVCLAIAPVPGIFDDYPTGRVISKAEAYELLRKSEEAGLVHLTGNVQHGQIYICNCCRCCCGVLRGINQLGVPASRVVNSHYYAEIDPDRCTVCGLCANERCQVNAIEEGEDSYHIIRERCIGCGLCISTCPGEAIRLVHKKEEDVVPPPADEASWFKERGRQRGVDFSRYE